MSEQHNKPQCFVAMWFGSDTDSQNEMTQLFDVVIKPAIEVHDMWKKLEKAEDIPSPTGGPVITADQIRFVQFEEFVMIWAHASNIRKWVWAVRRNMN